MLERYNDVKTTSRRRFDVIMTLLLRFVPVGYIINTMWILSPQLPFYAGNPFLSINRNDTTDDH